MFKTLIKWTIQALDTIVIELKRAYAETYELSDLAKEFSARVDEIKNNNKEKFIRTAEIFETHKGLFSLEFPTWKQIKERAKQQWEEALQRGDLDELYRLKERKIK